MNPNHAFVRAAASLAASLALAPSAGHGQTPATESKGGSPSAVEAAVLAVPQDEYFRICTFYVYKLGSVDPKYLPIDEEEELDPAGTGLIPDRMSSRRVGSDLSHGLRVAQNNRSPRRHNSKEGQADMTAHRWKDHKKWAMGLLATIIADVAVHAIYHPIRRQLP